MRYIFGFEDDVAIRVRDVGGKSVIDMRSKSRDGRGDLGANAARIRAYVSALEKRLGSRKSALGATFRALDARKSLTVAKSFRKRRLARRCGKGESSV